MIILIMIVMEALTKAVNDFDDADILMLSIEIANKEFTHFSGEGKKEAMRKLNEALRSIE